MIQHITDTERALQSRVNKLEEELERLRAAEPVAEVHRRHLLASDQNDGHWCREVLLYSGNSPHDWLDGKNTRVKLYRAAPPAQPAEPVTESEVRLKIVQELRSSVFLHCDVNKEDVLLCIKHGCTLLEARAIESAIQTTTNGLKVLCSTKRKSDSTSEKPRLMRMDCLAFDEISHTSRSTT